MTTILGKTASEQSQKALRNWAERNPGAKEAAAERGTAVHAACENFIRGLPVEIKDEYRPFWDGLSPYLEAYDAFLWSEMPLRPQWKHCSGHDDIHRVWSLAHGYVGCPDFVAVRNGVTVLGDFKTSNAPYCRYYPQADDRSKFTGWNKYGKVGMQLAAYAMAFEETCGIHIDQCQVLVSTPEITQNFIIRGDELEKFKVRWLQRVRMYYEILEKAEAPEQLELAAA